MGHRTFYRLYGLHYFTKKDDLRTSGIQQAINEAHSRVFVKDGNYSISAGIIMQKTGLILEGETLLAQIVAASSFTGNMLTVQPATQTGLPTRPGPDASIQGEVSGVENLTVNGQNNSVTGLLLLPGGSAWTQWLRNVYVYRCGDGADVTGSVQGTGIQVGKNGSFKGWVVRLINVNALRNYNNVILQNLYDHYIDHLYTTIHNPSGVGLGIYNCNFGYYNNLRIVGETDTNGPGDCVYIENSKTLWFEGAEIADTGKNLVHVYSAAGETSAGLYFRDLSLAQPSSGSAGTYDLIRLELAGATGNPASIGEMVFDNVSFDGGAQGNGEANYAINLLIDSTPVGGLPSLVIRGGDYTPGKTGFGGNLSGNVNNNSFIRGVLGLNPLGSLGAPANPLVSGTVYGNSVHQLSAGNQVPPVDADVYVPVSFGSGGSCVVAIGPDSGSMFNLPTISEPATSIASIVKMIYFVVPSGWVYSVTVSGTGTAIQSGAIVVGH